MSSNDGYYSTIDPFENYDSRRTSRFPDTAALDESDDGSSRPIASRRTDAIYPLLYNTITREPNELFINGGFVSQGDGAYVAKLDPATLQEILAREHLHPRPLELSRRLRRVGRRRDGYSVAGNRLVRMHADSGHQHETVLPQHEGQGGAAYNGFVVSPSGMLFTKSMERGLPCAQNDLASNLGLVCAMYHDIPSYLVAVDISKSEMPIVAQVETPEYIMSRISTERHDGVDFIYCPEFPSSGGTGSKPRAARTCSSATSRGDRWTTSAPECPASPRRS